MSAWTVLAAVAVLAAAAPYVAWIRHPDQNPFLAYLVFVLVFALCAMLLFVALAWLASALGVMEVLGRGGLTVLLLLLGVLPAFLLATWQARRRPSQRDSRR